MAPPGLEVLFLSVKNDIKCKEDALICALHWCIISESYKCVGKGEEPPASMKQSEMLPKEWSSSSDYYTLLYVKSDQCFLLKVVKMDNQMLVHFMRFSDSEVSNITMTTEEFIGDDLSDHESAFKDPDHLHVVVQSGLLDKFTKKSPKTEQKSTKPTQAIPDHDTDPDPLRVGPRMGGRRQPEWGERSDPFSLGRSDLDPLAAGGGGGMLMDPFRGPGRMPNPDAGLPQRLPPGAVPPGARFDPFGPANPERFGPGGSGRPGPDPDHLPPPGYDDMFM